MTSIDFPEANLALAKDQPQYQTLFTAMSGEPEFHMTVCLQLTDEEVDEIVRTRKIWHTQSTFGKGFSPIRMSTTNPFVSPVITDLQPMDENRTPVEEWDKTHYVNEWITGLQGLGPCINCGRQEQEHFWSSRQCKL